MHRKGKEQNYKNFTSEFRNAFVVRNKCEQLKLEKQHKSIDRLRAHESLDLMNKKKEILSLQMSILSSKPQEECQDLSGETELSQPLASVNGSRGKAKFRPRASSISTSSFHSIFGCGGAGKDNKMTSNTFSLSASMGRINQFKKLSRSISLSGKLEYCTQKKITTPQTHVINESSSVDRDDSENRQNIWKLLPPIQLTPLHKQKSKSLKALSGKEDVAGNKLSVSKGSKASSWNDLQECRYLRRRSQPSDTCLE